MQIRRFLPALAVGLLAASSQADAHAHLVRAEPEVGSSVRAAPKQVEITFSEAVEPRFSSIEVTGPGGTNVDRHDVHVPAGDARHLAVGLGPIGPGEYKVIWHATSVDTHKTEGSFTFTVTP
ncbi:MAG TPA: copper homeostasis periplasmic binding protein CopC [Acetobacteraceae bacterium]|jgi:methionine-rich copper-binding protein CopC|nr:copper homeostasis periplasmic binding protein CopC [Acetobacteraceae bacterium]